VEPTARIAKAVMRKSHRMPALEVLAPMPRRAG
jgi:hypothetical protein